MGIAHNVKNIIFLKWLEISHVQLIYIGHTESILQQRQEIKKSKSKDRFFVYSNSDRPISAKMHQWI